MLAVDAADVVAGGSTEEPNLKTVPPEFEDFAAPPKMLPLEGTAVLVLLLVGRKLVMLVEEVNRGAPPVDVRCISLKEAAGNETGEDLETSDPFNATEEPSSHFPLVSTTFTGFT